MPSVDAWTQENDTLFRFLFVKTKKERKEAIMHHFVLIPKNDKVPGSNFRIILRGAKEKVLKVIKASRSLSEGE